MRLRLVFALALFPCIGAAAQPAHSAEPAPDVILITLDTLRTDRLETYGYNKVKTPAISRLARDGVRFEQAFTPSPITNSSHASIFTGKYPTRHGVTDFGVPLAAEHRTLAQYLKESGYRTAGLPAAVILDSTGLAPGFERGFDLYWNFAPTPQESSRYGRVERRGMDVVARAEQWLDENRRGPRLLWVHLFDPHDPYDAPAPFSKQYKDAYDGEVAYTDAAVGRLLDSLRKRGWYNSALIVLLADHGEGLGEHGEDTHGIFLYDSTLRVPLIVKLPGNRHAGKAVEAQVRTTDVLPTILRELGKALPEGLDGAPLQPLWEQGEAESRQALAETDYPLRFGWAPLRALRMPEHKFIEAPRPELYDLARDPRETRNVYEPWNERVQAARGVLAELRAQAPAKHAAAPVDEKTLAELRALGYLGTDPGATNVPEPSLLPDPKDKIEIQNLIHRAMMASDDRRTAEARAALEQALKLEPQSALALSQLAEMELATTNWKQAAEYLARARKLRPDDAEWAFQHGRALAELGYWEQAREALETSLKNQPGRFAARHLLGRAYLQLGNAAAAQDQLEAAVFLEPSRADVRIDLARALMAAGEFADAVRELEVAERLEPKNAEIRGMLGKAREKAAVSTAPR